MSHVVHDSEVLVVPSDSSREFGCVLCWSDDALLLHLSVECFHCDWHMVLFSVGANLFQRIYEQPHQFLTFRLSTVESA